MRSVAHTASGAREACDVLDAHESSRGDAREVVASEPAPNEPWGSRSCAHGGMGGGLGCGEEKLCSEKCRSVERDREKT